MSGYIFPFIVYPYISRVLGVSNIGICNFTDSVIDYFILISMMGMSTVGVREIAKCNGDKKKLDSTFSELLSLNAMLTVVALLIFVICVCLIPKLNEYKQFMYIGALKIISNFLLINWFFQGLEEFKYVTIRTILIKCLYVVCIFIFVRHISDSLTYYLLMTLTIAANAIVNIVYSRRFVKFHFTFKIPIQSFKSCFALGVYQVLTSMYTTFNVIYLGFVCNEVEVGYYTTATKLQNIILSLYTAFSAVMLPRLSSIIAKNDISQYRELVGKSINVLFVMILPLTYFTYVFSPEIVRLISGAGYEGAALPLRIISPLLLLIGYDQILVVQVLLSLKKEKAILINSTLAAFVGLVLNVVLVSTYKSVGSSVILVLSELVVMISAQYFVKKYIHCGFPVKMFVKRSMVYLFVFVICICSKTLISNYIIQMLTSAVLVALFMLIVETMFFKNEIFVNGIMILTKKIRKK